MAIEYTWEVEVRKVNPYNLNSRQQNIIEGVGFVLKATKGSNTAMIAGATSFDVKAGVSSDSFTDIAGIDDAIITTWIETRLGEDKVTAMKAELKANIDALPSNFNPIGS